MVEKVSEQDIFGLLLVVLPFFAFSNWLQNVKRSPIPFDYLCDVFQILLEFFECLIQVLQKLLRKLIFFKVERNLAKKVREDENCFEKIEISSSRCAA